MEGKHIRLFALVVILSILLSYAFGVSLGLIEGSFCLLWIKGSIIVCPIGLLQISLLNMKLILLFELFIVLVLITVFGRVFCGWICPIGLLMREVRLRKDRTRSRSFPAYVLILLSLSSVMIACLFSGVPIFLSHLSSRSSHQDDTMACNRRKPGSFKLAMAIPVLSFRSVNG